jgi:hypothetical protein
MASPAGFGFMILYVLSGYGTIHSAFSKRIIGCGLCGVLTVAFAYCMLTNFEMI